MFAAHQLNRRMRDHRTNGSQKAPGQHAREAATRLSPAPSSPNETRGSRGLPAGKRPPYVDNLSAGSSNSSKSSSVGSRSSSIGARTPIQAASARSQAIASNAEQSANTSTKDLGNAHSEMPQVSTTTCKLSRTNSSAVKTNAVPFRFMDYQFFNTSTVTVPPWLSRKVITEAQISVASVKQGDLVIASAQDTQTVSPSNQMGQLLMQDTRFRDALSTESLSGLAVLAEPVAGLAVLDIRILGRMFAQTGTSPPASTTCSFYIMRPCIQSAPFEIPVRFASDMGMVNYAGPAVSVAEQQNFWYYVLWSTYLAKYREHALPSRQHRKVQREDRSVLVSFRLIKDKRNEIFACPTAIYTGLTRPKMRSRYDS